MTDPNAIHGDLPRRLGFRIETATCDSATGRLEVDHNLLQGLGVLHGGVIFAFADSVAASMLTASTGGTAATTDAQIRYLAAVTEGVLTARSRLVHESQRSVLVEVELRSADEKLVAIYSAKFLRPRAP